MIKKLSFVLTTLAVLAMVLTACGPKAAAYTCTDKIGCVKIGPTDPIHVAYLLVVAGPNSALGIDSRNGVEIAIDDAGGSVLHRGYVQ